MNPLINKFKQYGHISLEAENELISKNKIQNKTKRGIFPQTGATCFKFVYP